MAGAETMHTCSCGRTFPPTLDGAWAAKVHAEAHHHRLVRAPGAATAPA